MAYKALYRKWRPTVFSDVIGQEHITSVLKGEVMAKTVSHAYLFCGSRGTGKTTCAKILSRAVSCDDPQNGDPCGVCPSCLAAEHSLDIYEIDAASYNGVDNIRELRDTVVYPPSELKRRVYIIDEVHMLSPGAFNALLKTLEEPPEHALFILATTELQKIPATILSRCKRFDFHRITPEVIASRLRMISDEEQIPITDRALLLIARLASGAMRDALSMLELFCMSDHEIDEEEASARLGVVGRAAVFSLLDALCDGDTARALGVVAEAYDNSKDLGVLCSELSGTLRDVLVTKYAKDPSALIDGTQTEIETLSGFAKRVSVEKLMLYTDICEETQGRLARAVFSRRAVIENAVIRMCEPSLAEDRASLVARIASLEEQVTSLGRALRNGLPAVNRTVPVPGAAAAAPRADARDETEAPPPADGEAVGTPPPAGESPAFFGDPGAESQTAGNINDPIPPEDDRPIPEEPTAPAQPPETAQPSGRELFGAYAEFLEAVEQKDKIAGSMLIGGKAYVTGQTVELEVTNPVAPMLLGRKDTQALLCDLLADHLGFLPILKVTLLHVSHEDERMDLSVLLDNGEKK